MSRFEIIKSINGADANTPPGLPVAIGSLVTWSYRVENTGNVDVVKIAPFGTWDSPISAAVAATASRERRWVGPHDGAVWWTEGRPDEGGRSVVVRSDTAGEITDVLPAPWNADPDGVRHLGTGRPRGSPGGTRCRPGRSGGR